MDLKHWTAQMARNARIIRSMAEDVSEEQARWKPAPDAWSILEVINHLYDEEREDFYVHLDHILTQAVGPWPRIDPQGWVSERRYNQRDLAPSVDDFLQARDRSISWLRELPSPDWQAAVTAPFGQITAGDVFASWVAHDLMHIRQLVRLHFAYTVRAVQPYKVAYAGDWTL